MPDFLSNPDLRLIIFGGKGGTGKTTSAAATALYLSKVKPDERILVMSTDPAHSLGDSFGIIIGNRMTQIKGNLWGLEMDAAELYDQFMAEHGEVIKKISDRGTYFDREDIEEFFCLSLPGMDEVMAITRISDLLKAGEYDRIILDTAPTGHTLVLLSLPEQMERWVRLMDMLMAKHRYLAKTFTRRYIKDDCDRFIDTQRQDIRRVKQVLTNADTTEFVPVTIPEPMSIYEVERLVQALEDGGIAVRNIVVNRVMEENGCPFCQSRWSERERFVQDIDRKFSTYNLLKVPLFPHQIRGESLIDYADVLLEGRTYSPMPKLEVMPEVTSTSDGTLYQILEKDFSFLIFGGKGGVGKTSSSAASALFLAEHKPETKVLVFSTDPAHSLSDSFNQHIGNEVTRISRLDNLYALEIDGAELLDDFKRQHREDIDEVFDKFLAGGVDVKFDREVLRELLSVTPPGLDELMALTKIADLNNEYDLFVLDSAPSGHLVRFLELPHLVRDWLKATLRLLRKYRGQAKLDRPTERLLGLSRDIRRILQTLSDPKLTEFVMVTIPEEMAMVEMEGLAKSLSDLKIPSSHIVINMIIPPTDCGFCATKRSEQKKYIEEIKWKSSEHTVVLMPLLPYEVRGVMRLEEIAEIMYGIKAGTRKAQGIRPEIPVLRRKVV